MKRILISLLKWLLAKLLQDKVYLHRKFYRTVDINQRIDNIRKLMKETRKPLARQVLACRKESLQIRKHQIILNFQLNILEQKIKEYQARN